MAGRQPPSFPPAALTFLRALARHNDREWFKARKDDFESLVRDPMIALVERLADDFKAFAPELVASPARSLFRMYRDTRFSADKSPLKTHIAAVFPHHALGRMAGAGLYIQLGGKDLLVAGGMHSPAPRDLHAVRAHIASNFSRFRAIVGAAGFRRVTGGLQGDRVTRLPRGFAVPDEVGEYLKYKQFLVWCEFPATLATEPTFHAGVLKVFRAAAPLVRFLNEPLAARPTDPLRSSHGRSRQDPSS